MSGINSINAQNVSFCGNNKKKETSPKKGGFISGLTKPVRDKFEKKYDGQKLTPELAADFTCDTLIKTGSAVAGTALVFAKSRKATNGLTKALTKAAKNVGDDGTFIQKGQKIVKEALSTVKANNLDDELAARAARQSAETLQEGAKQAAEAVSGGVKKNGKKGFLDKVINKMFKSKEVGAMDKGLADTIDSHFKNPETVKKGLTKFGITSKESAVDLAASAAITAGASAGVINIADDVVTSDDAELAKKAALRNGAEDDGEETDVRTGRSGDDEAPIKLTPEYQAKYQDKYKKRADEVIAIVDALAQLSA